MTVPVSQYPTQFTGATAVVVSNKAAKASTSKSSTTSSSTRGTDYALKKVHAAQKMKGLPAERPGIYIKYRGSIEYPAQRHPSNSSSGTLI